MIASRSTLHLTVWEVGLGGLHQGSPLPSCLGLCQPMGGSGRRDQQLMGREARVITVLASSFEAFLFGCIYPTWTMAPIRESTMSQIQQLLLPPSLRPRGGSSSPVLSFLVHFCSTFIFINSYFIKLFNFLNRAWHLFYPRNLNYLLKVHLSTYMELPR